MFLYFVSMSIIFVGFMVFFFSKTHLLMMLMVLEFISISILFSLVNFYVIFYIDLNIIVYFIVVTVCEAVMGLVLLTLFVRSHGSDYFKILSLLKC